MINQLPDFTKARVLVVGDVMLDRYLHTHAKRISPEAPVPVLQFISEEIRAGGAANVAMNLKSLGAQVILLGIIGADDEGERLKSLLVAEQINCELLTSAKQTIQKTRIISQHQQLLRLDQEQLPLNAAGMLSVLQTYLPSVDVVVFSDYAKGTLSDIQALISACRDQNKLALVDPKGQDFTPYHGATLLTPNMSEFSTIVGDCDDENRLIHQAQTLRQQLNLDALLLTRSDEGMSIFSDQQQVHYPAIAKEVFDVTGAGDTVIATLAATLAATIASGRAWQDELLPAVTLANLAASLVVGKLGTARLSCAELDAALHADRYIQQGFLAESALLSELQIARKKGERIVMTNGCFDILHTGHVNYLNQARQLGDRLLVAINTDESVRRIKGADRPANRLESRAEVLAALRAVDWVVAFSEDTPERIIGACTPDFLVKGGDNDPQHIPGADAVRAAGGQVLVMDYIDGFSTTHTIDKIRSTPRD